MQTTDGAQSKEMWSVAWSMTQMELLKASLSACAGQGSNAEQKDFLLLLRYIKLFAKRLFIFLFFASIGHPKNLNI